MNIYQTVCGIISVILNISLVILIFMRSPKGLGFYKYLMIYISGFEAIYSIWDMVTEPICFNFDGALLVFRDYSNSLFSREASFYLICVYCGCFGFSMAVFGVHFIYRYGAVEKDFHAKFLSGWKIHTLFALPVVYLIWWIVLTIFFYHFDDESDSYLEETVRQYFDTDVRSFSYMIAKFYIDDPYGKINFNLPVWGAITCMGFMIGSSIFCVFFFGFKCYFKIAQTISKSNNTSDLTKTLQKQLFQALVVQTIIPLVLMYVPISVLFMLPMFRSKLELSTVFVGYTIATYPAIDPLPNMLLIKCYRKAIIDFFTGLVGRSSTRTDLVSTTPNI